MSDVRTQLKTLPEWPLSEEIVSKITAKGYECYYAGGCVRDALLGRMPKDIDLATSAPADEVEKLFSQTVSVGKAFGVIKVRDQASEVEVTTFRADSKSSDGRRPDYVQASDAKGDALRRDFTINGLFYNSKTDQIIDFVEGQEDLKCRVLKTIGKPEERFAEDYLRMLRLIRFHAELGFEIEAETFAAFFAHWPRLRNISQERIRDEFAKILDSPAPRRAFEIFNQIHLVQCLVEDQNWPNWISEAKDPFFKTSDREQAFLSWFAPLVLQKVLQKEQLHKAIKVFVLSQKEQQQILNFCQFIIDEKLYRKESLGRRIIRLSDDFTELALSWLKRGSSEISEAWQETQKILTQIRLQNQGQLPARILRGEEISRYFQGKDRKTVLDLAFEAQLEGKFSDQKGSHEWLKNYLLSSQKPQSDY